ncbi:MAG: hypothetical protein QOF78_4353 [Phycisphaerales bacterium]|jgi:amino acid transporter/nucleotide-binding universal stress UspA family protein|nr:hypothetical protein [Phycisphaerales bacterium]MEA2736078.1 hypothetical protein [Humisphaera sp.]
MDRTESLPPALALLSSERPRNVNWFQAGALLFGDWGTSRLYVLGLAFLVAGRSSFWLIAAMSVLILVVGWAYTHICRLYPDGGGVYTAGRRRARILGVIGALLLFADYTITASLSSVEAFHYFGLGNRAQHMSKVAQDPGDEIILPDRHASAVGHHESLWHWNSPGLWAIIAIVAIGFFNLLGPKHTSGFAIFAAVGMIIITLLIVIAAVPQVDWANVDFGRITHPPLLMWEGFVYIVLALSGVEAIANLTGVMRKPVFRTARKALYVVAFEVAIFNLILAAIMIALSPPRHGHKEDMLAFMAGSFLGAWGEWPVRILGGLLLLSATNTAVNGLMSILYVMSRDRELPGVLQKLNAFGAPWVGAMLAAGVPALVLLFYHDLERLASLYAIGVVGAVALNCILAAIHPRIRKLWRKIAMMLLGLFLVAVWVTLAVTKLHALIFVSMVMVIGLSLRAITRWAQARRPKPSLLRQAIVEQLPPDAWARPRMLLATAGSDELAEAALHLAQSQNATLVVAFIREVALNYRVEAESRLTLDTDPAAQALFAEFLAHGHKYGVPIIPVYDTGMNGAELIAEQAAINGASRVLIGSSRRGALHHIIKGSFQRKLEALLPPDMHVEVLGGPEVTPPTSAAA